MRFVECAGPLQEATYLTYTNTVCHILTSKFQFLVITWSDLVSPFWIQISAVLIYSKMDIIFQGV